MGPAKKMKATNGSKKAACTGTEEAVRVVTFYGTVTHHVYSSE